MRSIREISLKIKVLGATVLGEWGVFILLILAVTGSFGLGRLSVLTAQKSPISVKNAPLTALGAGDEPLAVGGMYVGAKNNDIYYFPWCTQVAKIAEEERRWFANESVAQKAGYHAATNCRGMASTDKSQKSAIEPQ